MTVGEFYKNIHGDYEDLISRLSTDERIIYFVRRFSTDDTYTELMEAIQKSDVSASFQAAHKLKGIAANLAFSELFAAVSDLSEQLRETDRIDKASVQKVSDSYHTILCEIRHLVGD